MFATASRSDSVLNVGVVSGSRSLRDRDEHSGCEACVDLLLYESQLIALVGCEIGQFLIDLVLDLVVAVATFDNDYPRRLEHNFPFG